MTDLDERFQAAALACADTVVWHAQRGPAATLTLLAQGGHPDGAITRALWLLFVNVTIVTSVALLNVRINGADDLAKANADTSSMSEDAAATVFSVESNDNLDPDHDAANTITLGAVSVSGPGGTTLVNGDAHAALASASTAMTHAAKAG